MAIVSSPAALPNHIESLLSQRSTHVAAIASIDATLARVSAALGGTDSAAKAGPTKAAKAPAAKAATAKAPAAKTTGKPRDGMTANDFVLEFIKANKNPSSQEINQHWIASGRKGMADNSLSLLTKAKKLKRAKLEGAKRGSRYSIV